MDLDISAKDVARTLGRAPVPFSHSLARELVPADLARLAVEQGITAPNVKRMNDRHHALAKHLASGKKPAEAALMTGYCLSRVSILQADPAFAELLAFYRSDRDIAEAQVIERVSTLTLSVVAELEDRMENDPDSFKTRELLDIATAGLDRTGHGPSSKVSVTSLTLTPEDMRKLALDSQEGNVRVIEARPAHTRTGGSDITVPLPLAASAPSRLTSQGNGSRESSGQEAVAVGEALPGDGVAVRAVDQVPGHTGSGPRAAGSLHSVPEQDHSGGVQTEAEHLSGGSASAPVQTSAGETVLQAGVHDTGVPPLEISA